MWNPLKALKEKLSGPTEPQKPKDNGSAGTQSAPASFQEIEKQGLLGKFFRHWKNPKILRQIKTIATRMQAEGVNIKDRKAVEEWIKKHEKEIESGEIQESSQVAKPQTFVKSGPEIGRNDPCSCGSGKKYKKCCALKT